MYSRRICTENWSKSGSRHIIHDVTDVQGCYVIWTPPILWLHKWEPLLSLPFPPYQYVFHVQVRTGTVLHFSRAPAPFSRLLLIATRLLAKGPPSPYRVSECVQTLILCNKVTGLETFCGSTFYSKSTEAREARIELFTGPYYRASLVLCKTQRGYCETRRVWLRIPKRFAYIYLLNFQCFLFGHSNFLVQRKWR